MKLVISLIIFWSVSGFAAEQCLPIEQDLFSAERIEKNPINGKVQVQRPYYRDIGGGHIYFNSDSVLQHVCSILGLEGGRIISSGNKYIQNSVQIFEDGTYKIIYNIKALIHVLECDMPME